MAIKGRTPIPKSQKEISNDFVQPYDKLGRGNPNSDASFNRGNQTSFRNLKFNLHLFSTKKIITYKAQVWKLMYEIYRTKTCNRWRK